MSWYSRLHARLGDFWWYTILMFVALRCGDVINAFIGLWLVPKYVPQQELGAVLPLLQVTSFFGLPISILVFAFTKFLNHYQTLGEKGKVKSLIRTFWAFSSVAILIGTGLALWLMPHFFERIRVSSGSLTILILAASILGTTAPIFTNALQALKQFRTMTIMNLFCAPIRLVTMLVAMPFRALSGYMLGQSTPCAFQIAYSYFALRREIHNDIPCVPFWRHDAKPILRYLGLMTLAFSGGAVLSLVQPMIVRQRLPEIESAAYYMISRFAELAIYLGQTLMVMIFPFAAEAQTEGRDVTGLLVKASGAIMIFGGCCALAFYLFGGWLFHLVPVWASYSVYVPDMALLAIALTLGMVVNVFGTVECAAGRFMYLAYVIPFSLLQSAFLVAFTGYGYFKGSLPDRIVDWMASLQIATLRNFIWTMLAFNVLTLVFVVVHVLFQRVGNGARMNSSSTRHC